MYVLGILALCVCDYVWVSGDISVRGLGSEEMCVCVLRRHYTPQARCRCNLSETEEKVKSEGAQ